MSEKNVLVVGSGVGGYPAAIRAARLGAKVTIVEKGAVGGLCLNWGCIPTKALLHTSELYEKVRHGEPIGLTNTEKIGMDLGKLMNRKREVIQGLTNGVKALLRSKKVEFISGTATFENERECRILETGKKIKFDAAIIATGSETSTLPVEGMSDANVITSKEALEITEPPKKLIIIGGGVIGLEFAQIFHRMGTEVIILELLEKLLGDEDKEVSGVIKKRLEELGIKIFTGAQIKKIKREKSGILNILYHREGKEQTVKADKVMLAAGRTPCFETLGLEKLGVEIEHGAIKVNDFMETNIKGIFAAGDCVGGMMLAHLATAQGEVAAKNALGHSIGMNYHAIPRCIYTSPQIAACGLTEEQARERGDIKIGRFPLTANGKASILNETYGMLKIIAEEQYNEILGVIIVGPSATELIGTACLGINLEITAEELAETIFAHPTISEIYREGAMMLGEGPIHLT